MSVTLNDLSFLEIISVCSKILLQLHACLSQATLYNLNRSSNLTYKYCPLSITSQSIVQGGIDSYELEEFLAEIMSSEFNSIVDDNSAAEV